MMVESWTEGGYTFQVFEEDETYQLVWISTTCQRK